MMIIWNYIKSDLIRYTGKYTFSLFIKNLFRNRSFKYSFFLRLTRHTNFFIRLFSIFMHKILSKRYFLQIPRQTQIGYGLYIGHHMCIVISSSCRIGNNVNLSQFTTIGSNYGNAAEIGDNVYIGPNVNIIENVIIGNNSTIGAGSVVTKDVPENSTFAGVPAKVISYKEPGRFVCRRFVLSDDN
jgi:serine O-acetyltransferase